MPIEGPVCWRRIFAWTQNRMVLPAWLGVGHALQTLVQQVPPIHVALMYSEPAHLQPAVVMTCQKFWPAVPWIWSVLL